MSSNREFGSGESDPARSATRAGITGVATGGLGAVMVYVSLEGETIGVTVVAIALVVAGLVASIAAFAHAANARDAGRSAWAGVLSGFAGLALGLWSIIYFARAFAFN